MSRLHVVPVLYGPTAVGKTSCAIKISKLLKGEIISADSRQFYKELNIGTAKPSPKELAAATHHFVGNLSINQTYSAGRFAEDAEKVIHQLLENGILPIVAGGSGLYIKALMEGLDELPSDALKRTELNSFFKNEGLEALQERLKNIDKDRYNQIDHRNPVRLIRAIEILELSHEEDFSQVGKPVSNKAFKPLYIGLNLPREELYSRINQRVDEMMDRGLLREAESLVRYKSLQGLDTVGYKELFAYLKGELNLEDAIELIKRNSRRFAKRQITWLKSVPNIKIFHPLASEEIADYIRKHRN